MENRRIIVSSGNKHKIEEIKDILKGLPFNILSKDEVGLKDLDIIEDKETLKENAIKKALEVSKETKGIVIADDTGLFVDKLDGRPGIYSARYAGENATFKDNNDLLLKELKGISLDKRTAKFITVIAIVDGENIETVVGECRGKIGFNLRGENGFGYDPLFIVDDYNKTFAELGEDIKNKISHRANALVKLRDKLKDMIKDDR
ncbi:MAG: RdgB/HAM1 family non-canonical purine NTP pyrophosphatase [Firmicutes bacterium]|nr:RdgB/HAM1 family non-canonical purine NTP pyrophosphatase [Bacillota bacterium]